MASNELSGLKGYISLKQAAELSKYHPDYLSYLIRSGKLEGKKIGKSWLTTERAVQEFLGTRTYVPLANYLFSKKALAVAVGVVVVAVVAVGYFMRQPLSVKKLSGDWQTEARLQDTQESGQKVTTFMAGDNGEIGISVQSSSSTQPAE